MADQIFKVVDKVLGTEVLVQAASKRKAEKLIESNRFEATKATPEEITKVVNDGGKILIDTPNVGPATQPPAQPEAQPETAAAPAASEEKALDAPWPDPQVSAQAADIIAADANA